MLNNLVSIIIPTYNYGRFIKDAIESVQRQTYSNFEIIVINDGSTDNTKDVLSELDETRLKVITIDNSGVSEARNRGLDSARGDYIAFLDADDVWKPTKLELQLQIIKENPEVNFVFTDAERFDENKTYDQTVLSYVPELRHAKRHTALGGRAFIIDDDLFGILVSAGMFATWIPTVLLKRSTFENYRFSNKFRLCEDFHYMARLYPKAKAAYITDTLVRIRRHGSNSYLTGEEMIGPKIEVLKDLLQDVNLRGYKRILQKALGSEYCALGYHKLRKGERYEAACSYMRSLRYPGTKYKASLHLAALPLSFLSSVFSIRREKITDGKKE